jgi:hypothetical protein
MPLASSPLALYSSPHAGATPTTLPVPYYRWEQDEWCWAACAQMLGDFFQHSLTEQCIFASKMFGNDCCQTPADNNYPLDIDTIANVFPLFGRQATRTDNPKTFEQIQTEIAAGYPVEIGFLFDGGACHLVVIAGAAVTDQGQVLYINDPDPQFGYGWCKYNNAETAYGRGSWQWSWTVDR